MADIEFGPVGRQASAQRWDRDTEAALVAAGWRVVRVWKHEDVLMAADRIEALLARVRGNTMETAGRGHQRLSAVGARV